MDISPFRPFLPPELRHFAWRGHPLDGKLLLFERDSGINVLLEGEETSHFTRIAPRTLLIAVTNVCNLTCHFCYRDLKLTSSWTADTVLEFCRQAADWGVLEVAFGGGEPMLFKGWERLIHDLYDTTRLCINFTTNGMLLTDTFLQSIDGKYGNIRVSLYDTNDWENTIRRLVANRARFGVNWLISPAQLPRLEEMFFKLLRLGVRDFLLLSYKGSDASLHLNRKQIDQLAALINKLHTSVNGLATIKLDVCWGDVLGGVPQLFPLNDCGAGDEFLSITSDKQIKPCSFHHLSILFSTISDVRSYWVKQHARRQAAAIAGCARLPDRALTNNGVLNDETLHLAAI